VTIGVRIELIFRVRTEFKNEVKIRLIFGVIIKVIIRLIF